MPARDATHRSYAQRFTTTRWSLVLAARGDSPASADALATLCEKYWYPLYAFVRRKGYLADQAQDLTQAFFSRLLEKKTLDQAMPERGRFRSFLLGSLDHFLSNELDRSRAVKRGGGRAHVSIDLSDAEHRYQLEPPDLVTPEVIFDRRWALTLLDRALDRLRSEWERSARGELFEHLLPLATADDDRQPYRAVGKEVGLSEGAIKVAVHRLRRRFRTVLREEIAETVEDPADVEDELTYLFRALDG